MIPKQFILTKRLYEVYKEDYLAASPTAQAVDEYLKNNVTGNYWHYDLGQSFKEEYKSLSKSEKFFHGCTYQIYIDNYETRMSKYLGKSVDADKIDFIVKELNEISKTGFPFCPDQLKENIQHSLNRQRDFLFEKAKETKSTLESVKDRWGVSTYSYKRNLSSFPQNGLVDLSNDSPIKKIRYLELLGIVDFLRSGGELGSSTNGIASIVSGFTGEKPQTIQPILNALNNPSDLSRNNPYNNQREVDKVKTALLNQGFKPKKKA